MKALKALLVLGLLCSVNGYVVKAESEDVKQDTVPVEGQSQDVEVATGTDTETTNLVTNVDTNKSYGSLAEAIENVEDGQTLKLTGDINNATGISVPSGKNFTIDFGGHTYTLADPGAGSPGTESNGFQLLKDSTIVMKNGTVRIAEKTTSIKRIVQNYADLTLDNMTFYAENQVGGEDYSLSFNNGNIVFKGNTSIITSTDDVIAFDVCKFSSYPNVTVTFAEDFVGTVEGKIVYDSNNAETHKLTIKGNGTFGKIESTNETVAKDGISVKSGTFTSVDVLDYLSEGADVKIELSENVEGSIVIPTNTKVNLDLNGKTITNTAGQHTITNNGELTITGEGTVDNVSHAKGALVNNGTATIKSGTFTRSKEAGSSPTVSGGNSWYVIQNKQGGMMTFDGGNVESTGKFSSLVDNYGTMTINDGTFSNGFIAIKSEEDTTLDINGGTITGAQSVQTYGNTTIDGGELKGQVSVVNWETYPSTTTINGGTIEGDVVAWLDSDNSKVEVKFDGGAEVIGNLNVWNSDGKPIEENENVDMVVESGSFSSNVSKYVANDASYVKVDDVYYAGTEENVQEKVEDAKESVEVIKGVKELTNVPEGVKVENKTGQNITVNGDTVANGSEVTVKPETKPDYRPSGGSSVSASNVSAVTADGDKVKAKEVGTASELKDKLADKKAVVASIEVGKADGEVTVTYKAGKEVQAKTLYVVNLREDGQLMLLDTVKADAKGNVVVKVKPGTTFTLLTKLNGWILDLEGNWYFYEEDGTPADRWLANAVTWFMIEDGKMLTNEWVASSEGRWYYVGNDGSIVYNQWVDGCWINEEGIYYSPTYNK